MSDQSFDSRRGPGAPLGNTNALKHGFYAKKLRTVDLVDIENHSFYGLSEEILTLRVFIRRLIETTQHNDDPAVALSNLRVISQALTSLARLVRTEKTLGNDHELFQIAIQQVTEEMGLNDPDPSQPTQLSPI